MPTARIDRLQVAGTAHIACMQLRWCDSAQLFTESFHKVVVS